MFVNENCKFKERVAGKALNVTFVHVCCLAPIIGDALQVVLGHGHDVVWVHHLDQKLHVTILLTKMDRNHTWKREERNNVFHLNSPFPEIFNCSGVAVSDSWSYQTRFDLWRHLTENDFYTVKHVW